MVSSLWVAELPGSFLSRSRSLSLEFTFLNEAVVEVQGWAASADWLPRLDAGKALEVLLHGFVKRRTGGDKLPLVAHVLESLEQNLDGILQPIRCAVLGRHA